MDFFIFISVKSKCGFILGPCLIGFIILIMTNLSAQFQFKILDYRCLNLILQKKPSNSDTFWPKVIYRCFNDIGVKGCFKKDICSSGVFQVCLTLFKWCVRGCFNGFPIFSRWFLRMVKIISLVFQRLFIGSMAFEESTRVVYW